MGKRGSTVNKRPSVSTDARLMADWPRNPDGSISTVPFDPNIITLSSGVKVPWKCATCDHEWEARISNRFGRGSGCGFCANLRVHSDGRNSIATLYPELLKDWVYDENPDPLTVAYASNKPVKWCCNVCSHEWTAAPQRRARGRGCKKCATEAKKGVPLTKREPISEHKDVMKDWDWSKNTKDPSKITCGSSIKRHWLCSKCSNEWFATPNQRMNSKSGCPYCSGLGLHSDGRNSLATMRPDVAAEWDYSKNGELTPETITYQSFKDIWFKCATCEHEWVTKPCVRTAPTHQQGCPCCAGVSIHSDGTFSVAKDPKLSKMWDYEKNIEDPLTVSSRSGLAHWFKCFQCDRSSLRTPNAVYHAHGCGYCAEGGIKLGEVGYVYLMKYEGGPNGTFFKIGVAHNVKNRRSVLQVSFREANGSHCSVKVLDKKRYQTMKEAMDVEKQYHSLSQHRFKTEKKFDGYTEMFAESILDEWGSI